MTKIDPSRISTFLRNIATEKTSKVGTKQNTVSQTTGKSNSNQRISKKELREKILREVSELRNLQKKGSPEVAAIAIKEILLWEFGDNFLNHPQYNRINEEITNVFCKEPKLVKYVEDFISNNQPNP